MNKNDTNLYLVSEKNVNLFLIKSYGVTGQNLGWETHQYF